MINCIRHTLAKNAALNITFYLYTTLITSRLNYFIGATSTVSFGRVAYTVKEVAGRVEPVLVLSSPTSMAITLQVFSTDGSAIGKSIDYPLYHFHNAVYRTR